MYILYIYNIVATFIFKLKNGDSATQLDSKYISKCQSKESTNQIFWDFEWEHMIIFDTYLRICPKHKSSEVKLHCSV